MKTIKALADYLRKTVKISSDDTLEQLNPVIDQKPEFANTKQDLRAKAIEEAIKLSTKPRGRSESSESYGSQHSTPKNRKQGHHSSGRHHRGAHKSSRRGRRDESEETKKEEDGQSHKVRGRKRSRSRTNSREGEGEKKGSPSHAKGVKSPQQET